MDISNSKKVQRVVFKIDDFETKSMCTQTAHYFGVFSNSVWKNAKFLCRLCADNFCLRNVFIECI